jgi:HAD superfamily hydrolase (TIGR01458 family)
MTGGATILTAHVQGLLIDLDGTVYQDNRLIPGALEALARLKQSGIVYRFVTNATGHRRATIQIKLKNLGIPVLLEEIFSAPFAAAQWLRAFPKARVWILTRGDAQNEFEGLNLNSESPDFIVLGDLMDRFTFELLNKVFRKLLEGAELVALQKNRFWMVQDQLTLDAGPFVAALEYASGKSARLIGKPSDEFFKLALEHLGLPASKVAMVGDDLDADIAGAKKAGLSSVLVRTGKFRSDELETSSIRPDCIIGSILELPEVVNAPHFRGNLQGGCA